MNTTEILEEIKIKLTTCAKEVDMQNKEYKEKLEENSLIGLFQQYEEAYREKHIDELKGKGFSEEQIQQYGYLQADVLSLKHIDKAMELNVPASLVNNSKYSGSQVKQIIDKYLAGVDKVSVMEGQTNLQKTIDISNSIYKKKNPVR